MRLPYRSLLGVAASVLLASTAMAQEHVRWNDDGTVDLMLGPDYDDAVITTTREELGTLFGPDEKPFEGAEITVYGQFRRPQGRHLGPDARLPAGLGGAVRRQAGHRRAAVQRALHQDDARPAQRHRRVRRLHGRRVLVRRHRAGGLRLPDRRLDGDRGEYPQWTYEFDAAGAARPCTTGATRATAC